MNPDELPDPRLLEEIAEEMPLKVPLRDYRGVMHTLREKNYSYQDIAKWLSEQLGVEVTRSQVSYVVNADPAIQELEEKEEHEQDQMDEHDARS